MGEEEWFEPEPEAAPFLLRVIVTDESDDEEVRMNTRPIAVVLLTAAVGVLSPDPSSRLLDQLWS